jgi:hypothetical protein
VKAWNRTTACGRERCSICEHTNRPESQPTIREIAKTIAGGLTIALLVYIFLLVLFSGA